MKRILLSILFVTAVISCNKNDNDIVSMPKDESGAIRFGVSELMATKVVSESTENTVVASGFNVAGVTSDDVTYFNELATLTGQFYETARKYYYPHGKSMDFYACHPVNREISVVAGVASVEYSHSKYEDLIAAKVVDVEPRERAVTFIFNHVLSQLIFTVKGSDAHCTYVLKSLTVKAPEGGIYHFAEDAWTRGNLMDQPYWTTDLAVPTASAFTIEDSMTFVPGQIQVTATWETYVDDQLIASYTKSTAAIGEANAISIEQGKKNTINLTLPNADAIEIPFSIAVNPWGAASQDVTLD